MQFLSNYITKYTTLCTDIIVNYNEIKDKKDGYKNLIYLLGFMSFSLSIFMMTSLIIYPLILVLLKITSFTTFSILFLLGNLIMVILYDDVKKNINKVGRYNSKKDDDSDFDIFTDPNEYDDVPF